MTECYVYCYIQYIVHLVLYVSVIVVLSGMLAATAGASQVKATPSGQDWLSAMCGVASVENGLEVRDSRGNIIRNPWAKEELSDLFYARLTELLLALEIRSVEQGQAILHRFTGFAVRMIGRPVKTAADTVFSALLPSVRKLFSGKITSRTVPHDAVPVLIISSFAVLLLSRKLSSVILRL